MKFLKIFISFFIFSSSLQWKATAHFLTAAVAERVIEEKDPALMKTLNEILNKLGHFTKADEHPFVEAASFPDDIKYISWKMFNKWHYITAPYVPTELKKKIDNIPVKELETPEENIVWSINETKRTLRNSKESLVDDHLGKSFSLRMLIHLIGDIHQPLHCISRIDPKTLKQDAGGNNFVIKYKGYSHPLHSFWDDNLRVYRDFKAPLEAKEWKVIQEYVDELFHDFPPKSFKKELKETSVKKW